MKYVKMLSLAALAAMALMAFVGASSASASTLCKTKKNPCPVAWKYKVPQSIRASLVSGTSATLQASFIIDTCTGSGVEGTLEKEGSSTSNPSGSVPTAGLTWSGCESTTDTLKGGELEIEATAENNGNGTVKAKGFEVTVVTSGVSCVYGAGTGITLGKFTTENKHIDVETTVKKISGGFLCPSSATWTATYVITEPTETIYVDTGVE